MRSLMISLLGLLLCRLVVAAAPASVTLVQDGKARCAIYVPAPVMEDDNKSILLQNGPEADVERARIRLRDSVNDLALYLKKMSGVSIPIYTRKPLPADGKVALLIGDYAVDVFGKPAKSSPFGQGWRLVVTPKAVGFIGESGESTSYAIYEVLDRLGCRWYMPSDMGEVVPSLKTISLPVQDTSSIPRVISRKIWGTAYAYQRRNRLGGLQVNASHALEGYIPKEELDAHPEWKALIDGVRGDTGRICWGNPEVVDAVARGVIKYLNTYHYDSVSLSPNDGASFCECDKCKALDQGDWDPSMNCVSLSDRYIHFINQVAERVEKKYPKVLFGFYAYVQYTRPPVKEKLNPNLVPMFAPITYCRAHAMTDATCPSRHQLLDYVKGWGKASSHFGLYEYAYNVAEVMAPNPMITKWGTELPIFYGNGLDIWNPETMSSFDNLLPGFYMGIRMSWDPSQKPKAILDEFYPKFYGAAAQPMQRYWEFIDATWTKTPEHAGSNYAYGRIFTPQVMSTARADLNEALNACITPMEYRRVKIVSDSFSFFEGYINLRNRLFAGEYYKDGQWNLDDQYKVWYARGYGYALDYKEQYAFCPRGYDALIWGPHSIDGYWGQTFKDGMRIAQNYAMIGKPINAWRYKADKDKQGETAGWQGAGYDDNQWPAMDVSRDTMSDIGLFDYFGALWYRTKVQLPSITAGKKVYLWVSNFDTICKLYVNGRLVPYVDEKGVATPECTLYSRPFSYDITPVIKPGAENTIAIIGTRTVLNEIGTGGLQGPVMIYQDR